LEAIFFLRLLSLSGGFFEALVGDDDLLASRLDERFLETGRLVDLDLECERDLDLD